MNVLCRFLLLNGVWVVLNEICWGWFGVMYLCSLYCLLFSLFYLIVGML